MVQSDEVRLFSPHVRWRIYSCIFYALIILLGYLWFWGFVFIASTTFVWVIKRERDDDHDASEGLLSAYGTLVKILKLPSVMRLSIILLTAKVRLMLRVFFVLCDYDISSLRWLLRLRKQLLG